MKKFFLFIAVVLLSIAAQAAVVTKEQGLSGFSPYRIGETTNYEGTFDTETKTFTSSVAWGGGQIWYDDGENALDANGYTHIGLDLASAAANNVQLAIEYTTADGHSSQSLVLYAGKTTKIMKLNGRYIKKIEIKNFSDVADASFTISKLYFYNVGHIESEVKHIVTSDHTLSNWNWDDRLQIESSNFASIHEGDKIVVTYSSGVNAGGDYVGIAARIENTNGEFVDVAENDLVQENQTNATFEINLRTADLEALKTNGMYINGKMITIHMVDLYPSTIWSGTQKVENWNGYKEINTSELADLKIGNVLCVRVSAIGSADGPRVSLFCGWNKPDALIGGEYYFPNNTVEEVEFAVTGSMRQQLGMHNLLVRGVNYTINDIYVKEGTPVADDGVKGYLTVSSAGMATFVLPFNVPNLPAGVTAYELTNDGSDEIVATPITSLAADKPVLIVASAGEYEFVGEEGASADISDKSDIYENGALRGTYQSIDPLAETTDANFNYVLQKHEGDDTPVFYQVLDATCYIASYRAYLSCSYNANPGGGSSAPKMRMVFRPKTPTGVENIQQSEVCVQKVLRDGQLLIVRNGVEYNVNGKIVK